MFFFSLAGVIVSSSLFLVSYSVFKSNNEYKITRLKMLRYSVVKQAATCLDLYWREKVSTNATICNSIVIAIIMTLAHLSDT